MLLSIQHRTELVYDERISETVMELRVAPKTDGRQVLRGFGLAVGPTAPLYEHQDWLGNRVHQFSIVEFHDRVQILAHSAVDTQAPRYGFGELSDGVDRSRHDHRLFDFLAFQGPIDDDARLDDLARRLEFDAAQSVGALAERVVLGLRGPLEYKKGVTSSLTPVRRVLDVGAGVCQDLTHVAIALFRRVGVPARYVSGYLFREGAAELETHAWCEVYSSAVGWVGVDPTHGELVGEHHVSVAVGRSYADVPPNRGVYRGSASEKIRAVVAIEPVSEVPRGLLAPLTAAIDVSASAEGTPTHKEQLDYQQEQQQQQQQQQ